MNTAAGTPCERQWLLAVSLTLLVALLPGLLAADTLHVAVASNFVPTARALVPAFEQSSGHRVRLSAGSTGKLYAQIVAGAPYDVLLAADAMRPQRLEREGRGVAGSRFTYATGQLVLWSTSAELRQRDCVQVLRNLDFRRLAIANPRLAPYGVAARDVLTRLALWEPVQGQLVLGENVAQALQFVASGNATLGLVAASSLHASGLQRATCQAAIPGHWHAPIAQQAIVLTAAGNKPAAGDFMRFLQGDTARRLIGLAGYSVPSPSLPQGTGE